MFPHLAEEDFCIDESFRWNAKVVLWLFPYFIRFESIQIEFFSTMSSRSESKWKDNTDRDVEMENGKENLYKIIPKGSKVISTIKVCLLKLLSRFYFHFFNINLQLWDSERIFNLKNEVWPLVRLVSPSKVNNFKEKFAL